MNSSEGDRQPLDMLYRANFDIFWSRYAATVKGVLGYTKEILRRAREGGSLVPFTEINTCRVRDKVVMSMAIQIMEKYLWKGRNGRDYIHFSTVCKLRTEFSDV